MIAVIIPSHNQAKYINEIVSSYEKQITRPDIILFVLDRCTDESVEVLSNIKSTIKIEYVIKDFGKDFDAGSTRDFGLNKVLEYSPEIVIFTDGDCIPSEYTVNRHVENLSQTKIPSISIGPRKLETQEGLVLEDPRLQERPECSFSEYNGRLIISSVFSKLSYSCNLALNIQAIECLKNINKNISNSNRIFNPEFDGIWGGEDNFVGESIYLAGGYLLLTSTDAYVTHKWHETKMEYTSFEVQKKKIKDLSKILYEKILNGEIVSQYTTVEKIKDINYYGVDRYNNIYTFLTLEDRVEEIMNFFAFLDFDMDRGSYIKYLRYALARVIKYVSSTEKRSRVYVYEDLKVFELQNLIRSFKLYMRNGTINTIK